MSGKWNNEGGRLDALMADEATRGRLKDIMGDVDMGDMTMGPMICIIIRQATALADSLGDLRELAETVGSSHAGAIAKTHARAVDCVVRLRAALSDFHEDAERAAALIDELFETLRGAE